MTVEDAVVMSFLAAVVVDKDIPPPLLIAGIKTQNIEGDTKMT